MPKTGNYSLILGTSMATQIPYKKDAHCSFCGHLYDHEQAWPRLCRRCRNLTYRNPLPVSVILVPVGSGLVTVRRSKPPGSGKLALPGGFVEVGETWQEAGVREVHEEIGLQLDAAMIGDFCVRSASDETILIFGLAPKVPLETLQTFHPTEEVSERKIIHQATQLAFPLHTEVVSHYFATLSDPTRCGYL